MSSQSKYEGVEELKPSELGTKEYWAGAYKKEMENFSEFGDPGEVWFGEEAAARMVNWLADTESVSISGSSTILDVGCGNGMLSVDLAREGFKQVVGVDYCESAIELSRKVAKQAGMELDFQVCDILEDLNETKCDALKRTYDIVVDKGTFDAISLGQTARKDKQRYVRNISELLNPKGMLVITSCNWTEAELKSQFSSKFRLYHVLPTPSFTYGGHTGHTVTSLIFIKL